MRNSDSEFTTRLISRTDSGIDSLESLRGKRLALGSADSAQAAILPMHYLIAAGIDPLGLATPSLRSRRRQARGHRVKRVGGAAGAARGSGGCRNDRPPSVAQAVGAGEREQLSPAVGVDVAPLLPLQFHSIARLRPRARWALGRCPSGNGIQQSALASADGPRGSYRLAPRTESGLRNAFARAGVIRSFI